MTNTVPDFEPAGARAPLGVANQKRGSILRVYIDSRNLPSP